MNVKIRELREKAFCKLLIAKSFLFAIFRELRIKIQIRRAQIENAPQRAHWSKLYLLTLYYMFGFHVKRKALE
jgi:hypothetical protein